MWLLASYNDQCQHGACTLVCAGVNHDLPWIMLMSGANCYSQDYSFLQHQLAGQGYLVAVVDQLHPVPPGAPYVACEWPARTLQ